MQPAIGVGKSLGGGEGVALSATLGFPVSFTSSGTWSSTLFLTPGVGFGMFTEEADANGVRPMLGAGARIRGASGRGLVVGVQKVFIDGGEALVGLGLTLPMRSGPR